MSKCTQSEQCPSTSMCDSTTQHCRARLIRKPANNATYAKECLSKGIPITYERGARKGQRKTHNALYHCISQKDRTKVPDEPGKRKLLPAPSRTASVRYASPPRSRSTAASASAASASPASPFVRPKEADLKGMRKDKVEDVYRQAQRKGYIDPNKTTSEMTKDRLINAIKRANKKLF